MPAALRVALAFLTRLPVKTPGWTPELWRTSLQWYPAVGLLIGLILAMVMAAGMTFWPAPVSAVLVVMTACLLSGGLHLDGLADSADAWMGGTGDKEHTLQILKDVHAGSAAVIAVVLILILKILACAEIATSSLWAIVLMPGVGRMMPPLLFATTPYARPGGGLGPGLEGFSPSWCFLVSAAVMTALTLMAVGVLHATALLITQGLLFLACRRAMMTRLGGTTGDTAGALVELSEACWLVVWIAG